MKRAIKAIALLAALLLPIVGTGQLDRVNIIEKAPEKEADRMKKRDAPDGPLPETGEKRQVAVPAKGPLELSVEDAVMLALENNRDLQVRRLSPVIAGTFEKIERGAYDPRLFLEFSYAEERITETARSTGEQFSVEGERRSAAAGLRQDLPTGAEVEISVEQERTASDRTPTQESARAGISITQSLLRGFGPAVNMAAVRQAELEGEASVHELEGFVEALIAQTETAYWNYVLAGKEIEIFERSLEVAKKQRDEVELRIEVGILGEIEAAAARAEVARREQALIDARSLLERRRLILLRLVNPWPDHSFDREVTAVSGPSIEPAPIEDVSDRVELARKRRPDLEEARLRLEQDRLEVVVTRNGLLPRLDVFIDLGKTGYSDSFSDSFNNMDDDNYDMAVGVGLTHYIGNRSAKARDLAAIATREQAEKAVANLEQMASLDVRLAINEAERARKQIAAGRITRELQEKTLEAEEERFEVGSGTGLLVAQAQRDLLAARINEVEAVVAYRLALIDLYRAEGSLLERRGIVLTAGTQ